MSDYIYNQDNMLGNWWDKTMNSGDYMASPGLIKPNSQFANVQPWDISGNNKAAGINGIGSNITSSAGAPGYNMSNLGGALNSQYQGANGNVMTQQGWGGLALGVGGLAANWMMGNKQLDFGKEQLNFSKDQFYKNYAMQMDAYRRAANQRTSALAYKDASDAGKNPNQADYNETYNTGGSIVNLDGSQGAVTQYDTEGKQINSQPTYNAQAAFTPTSNKMQSENANMLMGSALVNEAQAQQDLNDSRSKARKDSSRDSNTESNQDEKDKIKKITG